MKTLVTIKLEIEAPDSTSMVSDITILLENIIYQIQGIAPNMADRYTDWQLDAKIKNNVNIAPFHESFGTYEIGRIADKVVGVDWATTPDKTVKVMSGWGFPMKARAQHYWNYSPYSLCDTWLYTGDLRKDVSVTEGKVCQTCLTKLIRLKNKENSNE